MDLLLRHLETDRQHRDPRNVAKTGELPYRLLRFDRQAGQLADHEVDDIVGVTLVVNAIVNAIEIPAPARRGIVKAEQALFGEGVKKLNHEERIAGGLLTHELRQRRSALRLAVKGIGNQFPKVFRSERRKRNFIDLGASVPEGLKLAHQRMRGVDIVVPIGAD